MTILDTILGIIDAPSFGLKWVKALDLASKSQFGEALKILNRLKVRTESMSIQVDILKSYLMYELDYNVESYKICKELLIRLKDYQSFKDSDKKYLKAFVSWTANLNISKIGGTFQEVNQLWPLDLEDLDLTQVSRHFRQNYPLRCHPKWNAV